MLDRVVERLRPMGIDGVVVVTNAKFTPHFEEWAQGMDDVTIVNDGTTSNDDRLGAIGDIGFVLDELGIDEELVVVAGDNLFGADVSGLVSYGREVDSPGDRRPRRRRPRADARVQPDRSRRGRPDRLLRGEAERPAHDASGVALYYYRKQRSGSVQQYLEEGNNPDQPGRLVERLYPRTPFYTWLLPGEWYDIGSARTSRKPIASFRRPVTPSGRQ